MDHPQTAAGPARPDLSPQFLQVAQELGQRIGLDGHRIAQGHAVDYKGAVFSLAHDGDADPDGMILIVRLGDVTEAVYSMMSRHMLEHNALAGAARKGYYCILPDTDTAAQCIRLDMSDAARVVAQVMACIGLFVDQIAQTSDMMAKAMQMAEQYAQGEAP